MENNELMESENLEVIEDEPEQSGNGLKTLGALALTAAIGTGLFFGAKKLVKKIKAKREAKKIVISNTEEIDEEE